MKITDKKERTAKVLNGYKKVLVDKLRPTLAYLEVLEASPSLRDQIESIKNNELHRVQQILNKTDPTLKELDEADWLLNQISYLPHDLRSKGSLREMLANRFFSLPGFVASLEAFSIYAFFPLLFIWDRIVNFRSQRNPPGVANDNQSISNDNRRALNLPKSTNARAINRDAAMSVEIVNTHQISRPGGIDLSKTLVSVDNSNGIIQTAFDDPAMLRLLLNSDGLTPIIYNIKAMTKPQVDHFVGLDY